MADINLQPVFYPKSIAVIGASREPNKVGNNVLRNLIDGGFEGKIYPVNPSTDNVLGLQCFKSLRDIPEDVDLVVIAVPAPIVPVVLKESAEKKVKAAIVITAGFKETGDSGRKLETEIIKVCQDNNITLIGPNCLGVLNPEVKMNASFSKLSPKLGKVALISQSGAIVTPLIDYAALRNIGFSKIISLGNKALINESDIVEYLSNDKETSVILVYSEQLIDANRIIKIIKNINNSSHPKPVIVLKSGRTKAGQQATSSHTGALAGEDIAYEALFKQAGIIRVNTVGEMFNYASAFVNNPLPKGDRLAIVTNAGGPGVIASDVAVEFGLKLAQMSRNPLDLLGDANAGQYHQALQNISNDDNIDSVVVIVTPQSMTDIVAIVTTMVEARRKITKPMLVCLMGSSLVAEAKTLLLQNNVSVLDFPEEAVKATAAMYQYLKIINRAKSTDEFYTFDNIDRKKVLEILIKAVSEKKPFIAENESINVLNAYGFPPVQRFIVKTEDEAEKIGQEIAKPLALKIVSPDIEHESDAGGVSLNVEPSLVRKKFTELINNVKNIVPTAKIDGVSITEMIHKDGEEMIIGFKKEPELGSLIMFGHGGVNVEVFSDVSFRFAPLTKNDIEEMIQEIKAYRILKGFRRQPELDIEAVRQCLGRLSQLAIDFSQIKELDINPLFVLPKGEGVRVLDARIVL